jgi:hypothetical protein
MSDSSYTSENPYGCLAGSKITLGSFFFDASGAGVACNPDFATLVVLDLFLLSFFDL